MNELAAGRQRGLRRDYYGDNSLWDSFFSPFLRDWHEYSNGFSGINVDISENENEYTLTADCPGVSKDNLDVSVNNNYLTITLDRSSVSDSEENNYIVKERRNGSFSRSFHLSDIDEQNITAKFSDGVLKIVLPKKEECKPRHKTIEIN